MMAVAVGGVLLVADEHGPYLVPNIPYRTVSFHVVPYRPRYRGKPHQKQTKPNRTGLDHINHTTPHHTTPHHTTPHHTTPHHTTPHHTTPHHITPHHTSPPRDGLSTMERNAERCVYVVECGIRHYRYRKVWLVMGFVE